MADRLGEHVFQGRHARAQVPDLHAVLGGEPEQLALVVTDVTAGLAGNRSMDGAASLAGGSVGNDQQQLFRLAAQYGVQVRHLRPSVPTLEDVFAKAVGHD
jgi:hypothetical protein